MTVTENSPIVANLGTSEISTSLEITVGTHFHAQQGTETILVFLPDDGEACWSLLPSWSHYYQAAQCNQKIPAPVSLM